MDFEAVTQSRPACSKKKVSNSLKTLVIAFLVFLAFPGFAAKRAGQHPPGIDARTPQISIIIDDIGYSMKRDRRAIQLPGAVSFSFLPHTPYSVQLANLAHSLNKEVLLHQPMQAISQIDAGIGVLTMDMTRTEFNRVLHNNINAVPHAIGINNHMGSLLTRHPGHMSWLMETLSRRNNLFFVDSYTTRTSVVRKVANENWVPNIRRDVFLDDDRNPKKILQQFKRLLRTARNNGIALGIGHPYPETIALLEQQLPTLGKKGYRLVPISRLLSRHQSRFKTWRAYLSP